jgi:hypothetical protein
MTQEMKNLLAKFENKMVSMWQLDGQLMECNDDDRAWKMEKRQRIIQKEVDEARVELVAAIEALELAVEMADAA